MSLGICCKKKLTRDGSPRSRIQFFEGEQEKLFHRTTRCAYIAQDGSDISQTIKCLARGMSGHMTQLKRVARFLQGVPRKAQQHFCTRKEFGSSCGQRFGQET